MVDISKKQIVVQWGFIFAQDDNINKECKKYFAQGVTIGRAKENDINPDLPFVSTKHGKIIGASKYLGLSSAVYYQDTSKYGTWYLPPGVKDLSKAILIHKKRYEIQSGCWLYISDKEKKNSVAMHVLF